MCGIVGTYARPDAKQPEPERFAQAVDRLQRRGPDDAGSWTDAQVQLGHRRLAIVDLSAAGHQPMVSSDDRYVISYNGEIYNHRELRSLLSPARGWRSSSDTETLLEAYRAWGIDCVSRLNGMFAFAIWDRSERRLFLARDRMGVKPLYYGWRNGLFAFASRPSALTGLFGSGSLDFDPEALRVYLELGYIPAPLSFYRDIRKLPQAHTLLLDEAGPRITRYWDYRQIEPDQSMLARPEQELVEELDEQIRRAVKIRLMSDVPFGAFLSGGVDSALVVAAMKSEGVAAPNAFTIAFKEPEFDEGPAASAIAARIGVNHVKATLSVGSLLDLLPEYVEEFDEPFADSSAFPTMAVALLARRHVTVALTGDAGDELFGGYHYYPLLERLATVSRWPAPVKQFLRGALGVLPSHNGKLLAGALNLRTPVELFHYLRSLSKDFPSLMSADVFSSTNGAATLFEQMASGFAGGLGNADMGMRLDGGFTLADGYLQKVDVATMAYSLEARCPFTDYQLVEWAMRLPVQYKLRNGQTKYLLKKVLCKYLPPEMVYQPKKGFSVPVGQWLRGPLKSWAWDLIHDDTTMSRLPLDRARVRALFQLHASGARNAHPLLWAVLMLLCFVSHHVNGEGLPDISARKAA